MRQSWVEIDLDAIRQNVAAIAALVRPAAVCAVVKADGYGHGDVPVAEAALRGGADWLAVALTEEGARLREAGIDAPILLLSEPPVADAGEVLEWRLTPTIYREEFLRSLEAAADPGHRGPVHIKLDTGMHRVGADAVTAGKLAVGIARSEVFELEGVWTHFADSEGDPEFTARQTDALRGFVMRLSEDGISPRFVHAANSAGALFHPDTRLDMVRVGISVYGINPAPELGDPMAELKPAMRVVSRVSLVKRLPAGSRPSYGRRRVLPEDSTVVTVPIGYADGVARRLGDAGGRVLIGGKRFPFAGTITMDHIVVDVGDTKVEVGDEVVLLGRQDDEEITADEWATRLGTISYEIVCAFGPRLPRRYAP